MKVGFICHRYNSSDQINGSLVKWIHELAQRVEEVRVITLDEPVDEPTRTNIKLVGGCKVGWKLMTLAKFYWRVWQAWSVDCWFIWQGGPYPILLKPTGKPVFQWKAHPRVEWWQNVCSQYCSRVTFTSTPYSYPGRGRVVVVGHGIDTDLFRLESTFDGFFRKKGKARDIDYLMVSRITRSKKIEIGMEYVREDETLVIIGPVMNKKDEEYLEELRRLIGKKYISFAGPMTQKELVVWMQRSRTLLNFSETALDRSVLEAMACGMNIVTTNVNATWILASRRGRSNRATIVEDHSIKTIWDRILPVMEAEC